MIWFIFYLAISQKFRESAWKHWLFYFLFHIVKKYYKTLSRSKFFREINTLITSFVKTLIWRKKCWFFRTQCSDTTFVIYREINVLLYQKKGSWIDEIFANYIIEFDFTKKFMVLLCGKTGNHVISRFFIQVQVWA